MAEEAPAKEQVAKVRRVMSQRPLPSLEALAQSAARTPNITRFIKAKQKKLEKLRSDAAEASIPITSTASSPDAAVKTCNGRTLPRRVKEEIHLKGDETKTYFGRSRQLDKRNGVRRVYLSKPVLPHVPVTFQPEHGRRPKVKARRDIYELADEDEGLTKAPTPEPALDHTTVAAKTSYAEPRTSSFRYRDSPSPSESQESRTIEECLKIARQARQIVPEKASKAPSQNSAWLASGTRVPEKANREAQELPFSPQGDNHLIELELEILHLGEDDHALPFTIADSPHSPKRARTSVGRQDICDFEHSVNDADGESDADFEEPLPKKRRCSNRQTPRVEAQNISLEKLNGRRMSRTAREPTGDQTRSIKAYRKSQKQEKKKCRLPVGKLLTVSERPRNSDVEVTSRPAELSQDPISHRSDEQDLDTTEIEHHKPGPRLKINIHPRRRMDAIDISLFHTPKLQSHPPNSRGRQQFTPSYSDGFEGKEARPIGIYMPLKLPARRRESYQKISIRLGELTIVSKRPSEETQLEPGCRPRSQRRRRANATPSIHSDLESAPVNTGLREISVQSPDLDLHLLENVQVERDEDNVVVNGQQEEAEAEAEVQIPEKRQHPLMDVLQEQNIMRTVTSDGRMSETPAHITSPLKHKQSAIRDARSTIDDLQEGRNSASQRPAEDVNRSEEVRISQQLFMISAKNKAPIRTRTESLEVAQELIVSVQRRSTETNNDREGTDDEGDSEGRSAESYSESESEDKDASEEFDEELAPEKESEWDEESEIEASQEGMGDRTTENIGPEDCVVAPLREVSEVRREQEDTSLDPELSRAAEAEQKLPQSDHGDQGTRGKNSLDATRDLPKVASQALQLDIPAQLKTPLQVNVSVPRNGRRGIRGNDIAVSGCSSQQKQSLAVSEHNKHPDSSWRPRIPDTSGLAPEPEEEIIDSPTPAPLHNSRDLRHRSSIRQSAFGSQQLTIVRSRGSKPISGKEPTSFHDAKESVILGDSRRRIRCSLTDNVPESQFSNKPGLSETELSFEPQISYMGRVIGQLSQLTRRPNRTRTRTRSTPAHLYSAREEQKGNTMIAHGITVTGAFQHTLSPVKSATRMPTLLEGPSEEKNPRTLPRQASLSLGTMPGSVRKRMVSFKFRPPFKK